MAKNNVASVLLFVFVWLLLGVGGFSLVESRGIIPKLGFTFAWLLIVPPVMVYLLKLLGRSHDREPLILHLGRSQRKANETTVEPDGMPRKRTVFLLVFVVVWVIGTIFTLDLLKLSAAVETLTWIASVLGLVATIYLVETYGLKKSSS